MSKDSSKSARREGRPGIDAFPAPAGLARMKPYKAAAPEETVLKIRAQLARLGLAFGEEAVGGEDGAFSYCLVLVEEGRGEPVFQTMGKGRTDAYAKASAYGEMVERLGNLAFYTMLVYPSEPETSCTGRVMPFKYAPDEMELAGEELRGGVARLFRSAAGRDALLAAGPAIGVPFWNAFGARVEHLPFRAFQAVVGSNGMCSGNTPAEALIHGICEVLERHVLKQMFLSPRVLPDIPLERFAGHGIHDDLGRLARNNGYDVRVKDCSLGLRLPVLGLLIRDARGGYAFHLGSDPSPITALERCLTEMRQGGPIRFKDAGELEGVSGGVHDSEFWRTQLHLNIRSYEGHWPPEVVRREPDRPFGGFEHPVSVSDADDLEYVLGIVRDAGWDLLIRDNSFLGIPTYHVYVPGISEMTNALDDSFARELLAFDRQLPVLMRPAGATPAQRQEAVAALERYAAAAPSRQFRAADYFLHYREHPVASMSQAALREFLLQGAVLDGTADIPACFDCAGCPSAGRCNYSFVSAVWSRMREAMTARSRPQDELRHIVEGRRAGS